MMKQTIYYFCNYDEWEFFVYDNPKEAFAMRDVMKEKYGTEESCGMQIPKVFMESTILKKYYGTVWIAYNPDRGTYMIRDHYSDIKEDVTKRGYKLKKFELTEYKPNYWKESYEQNKLAKKTREAIENADLTVLEDDTSQTIKRRSPGFD